MPAPNHRPAERDEVYYWDTVRFLVDGTVFKLPRYQFVVGSEYFSKTYLQDAAGSCPTPPLDADDDDWDSMDVTDAPRLRVSVAGAVELEGVSADEFRVFLKLLFPIHSTTTTLELTKAEWLTVLHLSTAWHFLELRKLAVSHLDEQMTNPVEMITVGRREYVRSWVESGFEKLVLKKEAISEEESEAIGWETAVKLYIVRHAREVTTPVTLKDGKQVLAKVSARAEDLVREKFAEELKVLTKEERSRRPKEEVQNEPEVPSITEKAPKKAAKKKVKKGKGLAPSADEKGLEPEGVSESAVEVEEGESMLLPSAGGSTSAQGGSDFGGMDDATEGSARKCENPNAPGDGRGPSVSGRTSGT